MKKAYYCPDCSTEFWVQTEASEIHFSVTYCPSCAGPLELDESYDLDEEEAEVEDD
jgi:hypothetical protein